MAVTFTGTNTGNTYVAGQSYVSAGRVYTAQSDGTFRTANSDGTVRSTVGSSQDSRVTWGTTGGGSVGSGPGAREVAQSRDAGGSGPGRAGVVRGGSAGGSAGSGPGSPGVRPATPASAGRGAVLGGGFLTGGAPGQVTQVYIGGWRYPRDPNTSDGGDIEQSLGESDFLNPTWFVQWGAQAANVYYGVREWGSRNPVGGGIMARPVGPAAEHSSNYNWNTRPVDPPSRAPVTGPAQPERPWALTGQYATGAYAPTYPTVDYRPFQ